MSFGNDRESIVPYLNIGPDITDRAEELIVSRYRCDPERTLEDYCNLCHLFPDQVSVGEGADKQLVGLLEWERLLLQDFVVGNALTHPISSERKEEADDLVTTLGIMASSAYMRTILFIDACLFDAKGDIFGDCNDNLTDAQIREWFFPKDNKKRILSDLLRYQRLSPALFSSLGNNAIAETALMVDKYDGLNGPFIMPAEFDRRLERTIKEKFMRAGYIFMRREEVTFNPEGLLQDPDFL